jgi:hypothetical protein
MANVDVPQGLRPLRYLSGAPYNGAVNRYFVPDTDIVNIFLGGLVKLAGSADSEGVPTVTGDITTGDAVIGVVSGVEEITQDSTTFREASTARYVFVADDPNLLFEVQEDSVGGALVAGDIGEVADLTGLTSGSTVTGRSAIEIDSNTSTGSGDGTEDVFISRLSQRPDNVFGTNAKFLVRLNNHTYLDGNTGT